MIICLIGYCVGTPFAAKTALTRRGTAIGGHNVTPDWCIPRPLLGAMMVTGAMMKRLPALYSHKGHMTADFLQYIIT